MNPVRLRYTAWTLTALYAAFHFVMTHLPVVSIPGIVISNYLLHFLSYGFLGGCLYLSLWIGGTPPLRAAAIVIGISAAFGAVDELLQPPVGRSADVWDWLADVAGAAVAATCLSLLRFALPKGDTRAVSPLEGD